MVLAVIIPFAGDLGIGASFLIVLGLIIAAVVECFLIGFAYGCLRSQEGLDLFWGIGFAIAAIALPAFVLMLLGI